MGTRGFLGFVIDGQEKIAYNHSDSYPEALGVNTLTWLRNVVNVDLGTEVARETARALRVVTQDQTPTDEDIERLKPFTNLGVGEQTTVHWYNLLRETQGDPAAILRAGYIEDAHEFPTDSLFAEWGYVVDLDAETFEVYQGFQKERHDKGRFADRPPYPQSRGYYPVALVASWPLKDLPSDEDFVGTFYSADE